MKPKGVIVVTILFLIVGYGFFLYQKSNNTVASPVNKEIADNKKSESNPEDLVVAPQDGKDKVTVDSVTLTKKGFLVARELDGDKLSQIIEISKPLDIGTHKNVSIDIKGAEVKGTDIVVMIYEDYGSDGIFNDFDQPMLNENGNMTARYVKTGKPLPTNITEGESMSMMNMAGMKSMAHVKYTDKGFVPEKIEVKAGSMVQFVNDSSKDMWVASAPHPSHIKLPTFDQFKPLKKGAIYRYIFDKKGTWEYHDHINPSAGGVVTVN